MSKPIADSVTQVALAALALDVCSDVVIQLTNEIAPSENAGTPTATSATGYPSDGQLAPAFGCQESLGTSAEQPPHHEQPREPHPRIIRARGVLSA